MSRKKFVWTPNSWFRTRYHRSFLVSEGNSFAFLFVKVLLRVMYFFFLSGLQMLVRSLFFDYYFLVYFFFLATITEISIQIETSFLVYKLMWSIAGGWIWLDASEKYFRRRSPAILKQIQTKMENLFLANESFSQWKSSKSKNEFK